MLKIALGIAAVAALAAGPLFQNRAEATTLGTSAGLRVAIDANQPVEDVTYYGYGYRRGHHPLNITGIGLITGITVTATN